MDKELNKYQTMKSKSERFFIFGGLGLIIGILLLVLNETLTMIAIPLVLIGLGLLIIGGILFSKVVHKFKHDFLVDLMSQLIENGTYSPKQGLSKSQVYATEFLKRADRFKSEDLITGTIDGVAFVSSDVRLEERKVRHTKNGTQTYYEKYFLGRVFIFEFNKDFNGIVQCLEQGRPTVRRNYEKVKVESIDFNKKFNIHATSPHTAFYILTPHIIESMLKFERDNPGKLGFSFIDSKMYVGINNNKDTFNLIPFRKIDKSLIESFKRDVQVIYDLIDDLKLNEDIFKKEA